MNTLAEISITYKPNLKFDQMPVISSSRDCENVFRGIWSENLTYCEEFVIMILSRANRVLGTSLISIGGMCGTMADPKKIFQVALKANAAGIVLAHNHPSGNIKPSEQDIKMTRKMVEIGKLLEMPVLDHIIMTGENYFSFADEGLI